MTGNEYQRLALTTLNPALSGRDILINGVMGLCGEAGEAIAARKKLAKELGDVAWYLAETAHAIGYGLDTVLQMNLDKLKARYPDGFAAERSKHRPSE